jgi:uncharacterized membrane protein YfcA
MALVFLGMLVGICSGLLGVGGGIILVPVLVGLKYPPINAVAMSALAVLLIALSGTFFYYNNNNYDAKSLAIMAVPCVMTSQLGVILSNYLKPEFLMFLFGSLILATLVLFMIKTARAVHMRAANSGLIIVGSVAGFLAGMFGVGGGVVLVPLQVLFLHFDLKTAIRNSLAIVLVASCFSFFGHALLGNIIYKDSIAVGLGGIIGAQVGARLVPQISETFMRIMFMIVLFMLAIYVFWQAYNFSQ